MPGTKPFDQKTEQLGGGFSLVVSENHTFGIDALLLADFAQPRSAKWLCDLCSGCGIISVLWAAQNKNRKIDAVEIQEEAVRLLDASVIINGVLNINPVKADLRSLGKEYNDRYDLVACNPPYKKAGTGAVSKKDASLIARHEVFCTLSDIAAVSARILKSGGRLCLCCRPERLADIICTLRWHKIEPKRLRFVQQRVNTKPWLVLIEGKKGGRPNLITDPVLIVEDKDGGYSDEMNAIYNKLNHLQ
ncbi:MAG TPA: methyltransferase [Ruminiclostridium sp.]|nr:methyltransferase [Ruminiclostridium sp.]